MLCRRRPARAARGSPYTLAGRTGWPAGTGIRQAADPAGSLARPPATAAALAAAAAAAAFPLLLGGLAGFVLRLGAGHPARPGRLAGLLFRFPCPRPGPAGLSFGFAGLIAALFLQLRRGQDLARGGQLTGPLAQHVIGQVVIDQARDPPDRLLRRGDVHPGPLPRGQPSFCSTRCGRLAAHSPIAVNESRPASRAAIAIAITHGTLNRTPRGSRRSGSRASRTHSDAGTAGPGESPREQQ